MNNLSQAIQSQKVPGKPQDYVESSVKGDNLASRKTTPLLKSRNKIFAKKVVCVASTFHIGKACNVVICHILAQFGGLRSPFPLVIKTKKVPECSQFPILRCAPP